MPWFVLYDYVEAYSYDIEANEFNLVWRDDFDSFDSSRWHKASGGFDANSSIFHPDNVSVKAGNLVLKMEPLPKKAEKAPEQKEEEEVHTPGPYLIHGDIFEDELEGRHHRRRGHLHKSERFDREHIRTHRDAPYDERFWIEHGANSKEP